MKFWQREKRVKEPGNSLLISFQRGEEKINLGKTHQGISSYFVSAKKDMSKEVVLGNKTYF